MNPVWFLLILCTIVARSDDGWSKERCESVCKTRANNPCIAPICVATDYADHYTCTSIFLDDTPCDDGLRRTSDTVCLDGECKAVTCEDSSECPEDTTCASFMCERGKCVKINKEGGGSCAYPTEDGKFIKGTCNSGQCRPACVKAAECYNEGCTFSIEYECEPGKMCSDRIDKPELCGKSPYCPTGYFVRETGICEGE